MMATETAVKQMAADENTVEDILQDVFYEFVQAYRLVEIEQVGAWLFRVAKNRITDFFRAGNLHVLKNSNQRMCLLRKRPVQKMPICKACFGRHWIPLWPM